MKHILYTSVIVQFFFISGLSVLPNCTAHAAPKVWSGNSIRPVVGSTSNVYLVSPTGGVNDEGAIFKISPSGKASILHSFSDRDGHDPVSRIVRGADGSLYGVTTRGGEHDCGTVYKVDSAGLLRTLHSFNPLDGLQPPSGLALGRDGKLYGATEYDGLYSRGTGPNLAVTMVEITPSGTFKRMNLLAGTAPTSPSPLVLGADGDFYGVAIVRGRHDWSVFKVSAKGVFTTLHKCSGSEGWYPHGVVEGKNHTLFGSTETGGASNRGTLFEYSQSGSFKVLHTFTGKDGANPNALIEGGDGSYYGSTARGGSHNFGTVFRMSPSGAFTTLYTFTGSAGGKYPQGELVQGADGALYGTTREGGATGRPGENGFLFKITTAGKLTTLGALTPHATIEYARSTGKFTVLHSFGHKDGSAPRIVAQDRDGNFYGITCQGGGQIVSGRSPSESREPGTVFKMTPSGTLKTIFAFKGGKEVGSPTSLALGRDGNLYGTSDTGGAYGWGTVFRLTQSGKLTILHSFSGNDVPSYGLIAGIDGNFYGILNNSIFKMTLSGKLTTFHSYGDKPGGVTSIVQGRDYNIYGAAFGGFGSPTIFKISPAGTLSVLHEFPKSTSGGSDMGAPSSLIQGPDGAFYGASYMNEGSSIFKMSPSGALTTLYSFGFHNLYYPDSVVPCTGGVYGSTMVGGANRAGMIFKLSSSGTLTALHSFSPGEDGGIPGNLILGRDGSLYGSTTAGGVNNGGTVFRLTP